MLNCIRHKLLMENEFLCTKTWNKYHINNVFVST